MHVAEEPRAQETIDRALDLPAVEGAARPQSSKLTANDLVLGQRVPLDLHPTDLVRSAFGDLEDEIDLGVLAAAALCDADRLRFPEVDISQLQIRPADDLSRDSDFVAAEHVAGFDLQQGGELLGGEDPQRVRLGRDRPDRETPAFLDEEADFDLGLVGAEVDRVPDAHVEVAPIPVVPVQRRHVVDQAIFIELPSPNQRHGGPR